MRQGKNLVSNSDFNRKRGEEYLISSSFASENIVGGGQLRSTKVNASSRSIRNGGEGNYASLMSSNFADTETMLTNPDHVVGGGRNPLEASASGMQAELVFLDSSSRKGASHYLDLPLIHEMTFRMEVAGI